jgi:hypothetical protein
VIARTGTSAKRAGVESSGRARVVVLLDVTPGWDVDDGRRTAVAARCASPEPDA